MKTVELSKYNNDAKSWSNRAFIIVFVYPKNNDPFIVKGMIGDVEKYLENYEQPYVANYTFWHNGLRCSSWRSNCRILFFNHKRRTEKNIVGVAPFVAREASKKNRNHHVIYINGEEKIVRRVPRRWIPFYDKAIQ